MANRKVDQRGRSKKEGRHVRFYHWLLDSPAFRSLSPLSRALLLELMRRYNGSNNGHVHLSHREAAKAVNVAPNTANAGMRELLAKGFVKVSQLGSFHLKKPHATEWILTEHEHDGQLATRDFLKLSKIEIAAIDKALKKSRYQKLSATVLVAKTGGETGS
jgi:DNA-binding transcriptional regulator YhcF (GntR family)